MGLLSLTSWAMSQREQTHYALSSSILVKGNVNTPPYPLGWIFGHSLVCAGGGNEVDVCAILLLSVAAQDERGVEK